MAITGIAITLIAAFAARFCVYRPGDSSSYDVRAYGAKGDGFTKDTRALQSAIDAAGGLGGRVRFPPGKYLSGTLHLRTNVSVTLDAGATLIASRDDADFDPYERVSAQSVTYAKPTWILPPRMQRPGVLVTASAAASTTIDDPDTTYAHYSLILADGVSNINIEGLGTIDGNSTERGGPKLITLKNCHQITIRHLTLRNAPSYNVSLMGSEHVDVEDLKIVNGYADGIDPDNSRFVRIANCYIDTWDDAICAKASLALGQRLATENLSVVNCILRTSNNGLKFGTESEGDLRNATFSNCIILPRTSGRAPITGVAIESVDGGKVSAVRVFNVVMCGVRTPIFLRLGNRGRGMSAPHPGRIADVAINKVTALDAVNPCSINGLPNYPIHNVSLSNINVQEMGGGMPLGSLCTS